MTSYVTHICTHSQHLTMPTFIGNAASLWTIFTNCTCIRIGVTFPQHLKEFDQHMPAVNLKSTYTIQLTTCTINSQSSGKNGILCDWTYWQAWMTSLETYDPFFEGVHFWLYVRLLLLPPKFTNVYILQCPDTIKLSHSCDVCLCGMVIFNSCCGFIFIKRNALFCDYKSTASWSKNDSTWMHTCTYRRRTTRKHNASGPRGIQINQRKFGKQFCLNLPAVLQSQ